MREQLVNKRVVLVVKDRDFVKMKTDSEAILFEPNTRIIRYPSIEKDELAVSLNRAGLVKPGAILLRSPYDQTIYTPIADARTDFSRAKFRILVRICQALGATKVTISAKFDHKTERTVQSDTKSAIPAAGSLAAKIKLDFETRLQSEFDSISEFSGAEPDLTAAWNIIEENELSREEDLIHFIKLRSFSGNLSKLETFKTSLARETDSAISIAAKLEIPAYLKIDSELEIASKERLDCRLEVKVSFR